MRQAAEKLTEKEARSILEESYKAVIKDLLREPTLPTEVRTRLNHLEKKIETADRNKG